MEQLAIKKRVQLELEKIELEKMEWMRKMEQWEKLLDCHDKQSDPKECHEANSDFPVEEIPSCEAVGDQDDQEEEPLDEQRDDNECAEADAEEHDEVSSDDE